MSERGQNRKKILVSRPIQGRLMARFATYWVVYHVALWHAMFLYAYIQQHRVNEMLTATGKIPEGASAVSFIEMYGKFFQTNHSVLLCAAAMLPVFLWDLAKLAHRVAGPVVRFRDVLSRLARGERVEQVKLRKGDLMQSLEGAFNEYLHALNSGEISAKQSADESVLDTVALEIDEAQDEPTKLETTAAP